ncbi:uncharacterized protein F5891DRAFT_982725 [Suillus fuscotomentosus]|uniref:Uncharacterized protein n=1 Tax=Suillus fuscotomentosus TaxID=1912939 RepID=A0AAD4E0F4_9AGAM|nr:uncharacterized protein F5891DRAFT_982725 [Suillus fuscotomentosus]KAG1897337.1 hypothetical protein F5891DRAFT_982725 [Suillus fuscotomentosus]
MAAVHTNTIAHTNYPAAPSPLTDSGAWDILEQYLTTDMMYPQMEEAFSAYLVEVSMIDCQGFVFNDRVGRPKSNPYILTEAEDGTEGEEDDDDADGPSAQSPKVVHIIGTEIAQITSLNNFGSQGFHVTVSIWTAGQLYVVADSPRTITASLPISHTFAVKQYLRISEDECEAVECSCSKLPSPAWAIQARVIAGELRPNVPRAWKRSLMETEGQLTFDSRMWNIFFVSVTTVRVVAGPYLGLEGQIIQISDDVFHVCQGVSKEEVLVSRYYLDRCPLHHILHSSLPTQQHLYSPPESESLQVGDHIEVLAGEHWKKCGIVEWIPTGGTMLWFRDASPVLAGDDVESGVGPFRIQVPVTIVQRTKLPNTLRYTKDKGYDVRPGDVTIKAKGSYRASTFQTARLTLLSDSDHSLIDVPITFVIKKSNIIGHEVFIVGGDRKGYRATLHDVASDTCTVTVHGQARTTLRRQDVVTSYGMRLNGAILEGPDLISFCDIRRRSYTTMPQHRSITPPPVRLPSSSSGRSLSSWTSWAADPEGIVDHPLSSIAPSSSTFDRWIVNPEDTQDNIDTRAVSLQDSGLLPWLMSKEFSSTFLFHHVVLKVGALRFNITISPPKI